MKIKLGQCRCMALVYLVEEAGLRWTADMTPLEADDAVQALLAGRELYRVTYVGSTPSRLSTAKPAVLQALRGEPGERPIVVPNHGCPTGAVRALEKVGVVPGDPKGLQGPPVAPQTPSWGQPALDPATPVDPVRSDGRNDHPRCDDCGLTMKPGEYVGVQVGTVWVWAYHEINCGKAAE